MKFDTQKAKAVLLYIIRNTGLADFHKLFNILYFAEKEHLVKYGRSIIGDNYIAMKFGPVPSFIYDCFKAIRGDGYYIEELENFYRAFEVKNDHYLQAKEEPDMEELSQSDIECLTKVIKDNKNLSFTRLSEKSHDHAWKSVTRDDTIDMIKIAESGGANKEMIKYIKENKDYHNISFE